MKQNDVKFCFNIAKLAANRSSAIRLKVGGVILDKDDNMVSYSYNGTPRGFDNACEYKEYAQHIGLDVSEHYPLIDNKVDSVPYKLVTKPLVIHCEANLVAHAARRGISINGGSVFLTHSPCEQCASLLYQSGIKVVYFIERFRTFDKMFKQFGSVVSFYQNDEKTNTVQLLFNIK